MLYIRRIFLPMYRVAVMIVNTVVQVLLAIAVVIILFVFAFFIYNRELLQVIQNRSNKAQEVPIFSGIVDIAEVNNRQFNTRDDTHPTFKDINPSYNQAAGAEFTYNFWLYVNIKDLEWNVDENQIFRADAGLTNDDLILLLKGNNIAYTYQNLCKRNKTDILVKCPLIKLQRGGDILSVEFNTMNSPEAVREQSRNVCREQSNDWNYINAHKLAISGLQNGPNATNYDSKWFMVTVIIQDTNPLDPLPMRNKCRCRIFVNGTMELDRYVDGQIGGFTRNASVLRQNESNLHIAPKVASSYQLDANKTRHIMMADLTYFNYALDAAAIVERFKAGFNKTFATLTSSSSEDPLKGASVDALSYGSDRKQLMSF